MKAHILVAGAGGYVGSHMVLALINAGYKVTSLDNFSTGFRDAIIGGAVVEADLDDKTSLEDVFSRERLDAVMLFASSIQVAESVTDPAKYYRNNVANTLNLLEVMHSARVLRLVFSSSAAVYGEPTSVPILESFPTMPTSPYGRSKLIVEQMLTDFDRAYGMKSVSLRYFNAAGADPVGRIGERHNPESHLIPNLLQVASGRKPSAQIFGRDYPTPDGTCIRDFIHVCDLCDAHLFALKRLLDGGDSACYNLGNGRGHSILEVIDSVKRVTSKPLVLEDKSRRDGDPAQLVASNERISHELGWRPSLSALDRIVEDAWRWEQRQCELGN
jgi:UDP-glucose 4-epimerase